MSEDGTNPLWEKHRPSFERWKNGVSEDRANQIGYDFYEQLRQESGLLVPIDEFLLLCFEQLTLEGQKLINSEDHSEEDHDKAFKTYIRWKIGNKNLCFDLIESFYNTLLEPNGALIDFDDFLFHLWQFMTIEGRECFIEIEQSILEENK